MTAAGWVSMPRPWSSPPVSRIRFRTVVSTIFRQIHTFAHDRPAVQLRQFLDIVAARR
jgi:hypothetical protein